jgi:hypothetical protein
MSSSALRSADTSVASEVSGSEKGAMRNLTLSSSVQVHKQIHTFGRKYTTKLEFVYVMNSRRLEPTKRKSQNMKLKKTLVTRHSCSCAVMSFTHS